MSTIFRTFAQGHLTSEQSILLSPKSFCRRPDSTAAWALTQVRDRHHLEIDIFIGIRILERFGKTITSLSN